MSQKGLHKEVSFGIGDKVRVYQKIKEGDKERNSIFEGMVIAFKHSGINKTFTVRKIGVHRVGIERIFPLESPFTEKIEVIKKGLRGVKKAKLYYTRKKSPKEIEKIFSRSLVKERAKTKPAKKK